MQISIDLELSLSQTELENGLESEAKSLPLSNEVSEQYNQLQFYKRYDFIKNVSSKKSYWLIPFIKKKYSGFPLQNGCYIILQECKCRGEEIPL